MNNVKKDFAGILRQYNDYQTVKRKYYRLGGLSFGLLSVLIIVVSLPSPQKSDNHLLTEASHSQSYSEIILGPQPQRTIEFPTIVAPSYSTKKVIPQSAERKPKDIIKQANIGAKLKEDHSLVQNLESAFKENSPAEPVEGFSNLYKYFHANLSYPKEVVSDSIEGVVKVVFVVNPDSSISNLQVLQSLGSELDTEAIRLVKSMPKWKPAVENGIVIPSSFIIPVRFNIKDNE